MNEAVRRIVEPDIANRPTVTVFDDGTSLSTALSLFDVPEFWSQEVKTGRTLYAFDYAGGPEKLVAAVRIGGTDIVLGKTTGRVRTVSLPSGQMPSDTARAAIEALKSLRQRDPSIQSRSDVAVRRILGDRSI